jgi:hypothetical protein
MTTSENQENVKRKVMAKGYCQPRKKKQKGRQCNKRKGDGSKHEPKKNMEKKK